MPLQNVVLTDSSLSCDSPQKIRVSRLFHTTRKSMMNRIIKIIVREVEEGLDLNERGIKVSRHKHIDFNLRI